MDFICNHVDIFFANKIVYMCRPVFSLVAALVKVPTCGRISVSLNTTSDPSYSCFFPPLSSNTTFLSFSFMCSDQYCPSFTIIFISNLVRTRARSFSRFFFLFQSMFILIQLLFSSPIICIATPSEVEWQPTREWPLSWESSAPPPVVSR